MAPGIGPDAVTVEGIVGEIRENEWELWLLRVEHEPGHGALWNRERAVFPNGAFASVRERRLHKTRTAVFAGVITAAVLLVGKAFGLGGFFEGGGGDGGMPPPVE